MYVAHAVYLGAVIYICGVCTTCLVGSGMSCVLLWPGAMVCLTNTLGKWYVIYAVANSSAYCSIAVLCVCVSLCWSLYTVYECQQIVEGTHESSYLNSLFWSLNTDVCQHACVATETDL